ncbi:phosphatases II [Neoconidiobolus thromboides FSU 785]|nr:phosphatases II [Neoconidiobolus thromboides FSU 785]
MSQAKLLNPPTFVEKNGLKFLIFDAPSAQTLPLYLKEFKKYHVTDVVRVCDPTYPIEPLEKEHIKVHELSFPDGKAPPKNIVNEWLEIVQKCFQDTKEDKPTIGVHCVAGLGRAPVLVAIALIEQGMSPLDSVQFLRENRKGAINNKQIEYIEAYRRQGKGKCIIC